MQVRQLVTNYKLAIIQSLEKTTFWVMVVLSEYIVTYLMAVR